jgi:hypothetical protein
VSFPDDFETRRIADATGLDRMEAYMWRVLCGSHYEDKTEVVLRTIRTYLDAGVPRGYVHAVTGIDHKVCSPVEHAQNIVEMHKAGVVPVYMEHARDLHPGTISRLARAGVPYEMVGRETRPSAYASVLIVLHRSGVPCEYAKPLLDRGYTLENAVGAWEAGIPLEFAMEVDGGLE